MKENESFGRMRPLATIALFISIIAGLYALVDGRINSIESRVKYYEIRAEENRDQIRDEIHRLESCVTDNKERVAIHEVRHDVEVGRLISDLNELRSSFYNSYGTGRENIENSKKEGD